ncbi:MAG: hypothetical protein PWQ82_233 [Thermosediminibacterales bacterium]|nr:hypothetical protein [Thermosediminibacterales bacterium]MDK2835255.1 hypothetical protein [Thermosediminibacterales bacterium]
MKGSSSEDYSEYLEKAVLYLSKVKKLHDDMEKRRIVNVKLDEVDKKRNRVLDTIIELAESL